jgi:2-polyprenyl-6-methoxyphenol hydroxylase-like FAD-dependent oxidoreductase
MMFDEMRPEVLVVGAGPVGLFTALALARRNVGVRIIDTGAWPCAHSYALALHPQSMDLLRELGLAERVLADSRAVRRLAFYQGMNRQTVLDVGTPDAPLAVVRQDRLEALLEEELAKLGVKVGWRHEAVAVRQSADQAEVTVQKYVKESRGYVVAHTEWVVAKSFELTPAFVVGADGHNSRVRLALDADFPALAPARYFAVFEFESDFDLDGEMRAALGPETTDALWPLPGGRLRWGFELPNFTDPDKERLGQSLREAGFGDFPSERDKDRTPLGPGEGGAVLDENNLRALIARRAPWFTGSINRLAWRTVVRFEQRQARRFGAGRLWLAGDAAHLTGPAGIHSMNAGLAEGYDLTVAMAGVLRGGAAPATLDACGERASARWQASRAPAGGPAARMAECLPATGAEFAALAESLSVSPD